MKYHPLQYCASLSLVLAHLAILVWACLEAVHNTTLDHLKSRQVRYSDLHCIYKISLYKAQIINDQNSTKNEHKYFFE